MTKKGYDLSSDGEDKNSVQNGSTVEFGNSMYDDEKKVKGDESAGVFVGDSDGAPNTSKEKETKEKKEEEKKEEQKSVGLGQLFRYATCTDILLMLLGTFCACLHGAALPGLIILFGDMTDLFIENGKNIVLSNATLTEMEECDWESYGYESSADSVPPDDMEKILTACGKEHIVEELERLSILGLLGEMGKYSLYYVYLGIAVLFLAYGQVAFWLIPSYRQTQHVRTRLFGHIMRQEVGWFDVNEVSELNTRLSEDINKIQEGIGDKVSNFFQWFSTFLAGIIIGFVYGWKLCLVILATSPLLVISGGIMTMMTTSATQAELSAYAKAGAVAEEVFSSIRTVFAFGGEKKESKRYLTHLQEAKALGIRKSISNGIGMGLVFFIIFAVYALAFWYGAKLVREDDYTAGRMLIVFFCVLIGAFALGNAAPSMTNIAAARGAAYMLWELLDRDSQIDSYSTEGNIPTDVKGTVNFVDVKFNYPSRPDVPVLTSLNLEVKRGQTVALVGSSGCGKSTVVQLLQRFYDPESGSVQIDGTDIRTLNIKWLRQHIGVVSQEPVLFDTTILENIKFGREDVTDEEVEKATREANAHEFIMKLPHKYDTLVGERGAQLSGGQKQRIAIARALVRDPRILLLDEATSALDTESEAVVQAALDHARVGRTTIVIAHRLSTIKNADLIYSLQNGKVFESGSHNELMGKGQSGIYYQLVNNQKMMETETGELFEEKEVHRPEFKQSVSVVSAKGSMRRKRGVSESETHGDKKDEKLPEASLLRIMKMNSSEWLYIVVGCFAAIMNGAVQPAYAMIFAEILGVFTMTNEEQEKKALFWSMMFLVIAVCAGLAMFFQSYMFGVSGECLTLKIRSEAFDSLLRQDISYYDDHSNSTGALCTRLSTDASAVQGATGARLGTVCMSIAAIGTGIIIGFIYSWKLTLLILGFVPVLVIAGTLQMKILAGQAGAGQEAMETAGKVAVQALENIRTVASLTKEPYFLQEYTKLTDGPYRANMKKAHAVGFTFSFTQAITFFAQAAAFYLGAYLVENDGLNFVDMFKVFMAIIFGAMGVGQASSFAPDYGKAKLAAARIFALFDRVPIIDVNNPDGKKLDNLTGTIEFKNLQFSYPTRPTVTVLKGLQVTVKPQQVLAFVGSSGCGKSTSVALIERFYDPQEGTVELDGHDVKTLDLEWLRSKMGIVQQEPILFDRSIGENIAYGDNSREDIPMDEIIKAAREANIHSFIETLPDGYDTNVGEKGTQLSGGQKQRVAIARALLRDPRILLLDEATSALDTESEKVVQEALDKAQRGRTTVVIAHRLSTIQNADCITVIHNGKVAEAGNHSELLAKKGFYHKLNLAQQRKGANK